MQWNPKLVIALSTAVVLLGAQAKAVAQTEEEGGCIGIFYKDVAECPSNNKAECKVHFPQCGNPHDANCGPNYDQILLQCVYGVP